VDIFTRKIRRLQPDLNPQSWVPEASMLTTRPPKPLPRPCCSHAVPLPCHAMLIYTCHATPLPFSDSAVSFVKVRQTVTDLYASDNNLRGTPLGSQKSRTWADRLHAFSGWPVLIHTCHAHVTPMPHCAIALRSHFQNNIVMAWHRHGVACVNQTQPHRVNKMGKTQSKPLAAWHGTAWQGNDMDSA
jgi:hypothetical protein